MSKVSSFPMPIIYPCLSYRDPVEAHGLAHQGLRVAFKASGVSRPRRRHRSRRDEPPRAPASSCWAVHGQTKDWVSAKDLPAVNQTLYVVVDDPDAHFARAKAAGAGDRDE